MKFIIISIILFFIVFKLISFVFKLMLGSSVQNQQRYQSQAQQRAKKPSDGNVNIDYIPRDKEDEKNKNFNGGEYIDYEEVK